MKTRQFSCVTPYPGQGVPYPGLRGKLAQGYSSAACCLPYPSLGVPILEGYPSKCCPGIPQWEGPRTRPRGYPLLTTPVKTLPLDAGGNKEILVGGGGKSTRDLVTRIRLINFLCLFCFSGGTRSGEINQWWKEVCCAFCRDRFFRETIGDWNPSRHAFPTITPWCLEETWLQFHGE